ncbi:2271_t:CDS:2 [Diversispora eburnea]|uniref:2271_t:CDS:1 n=1 Tax=Diversispora eburnea TaxID=1213867 RepID=A0A9N8ZNH7_9GLOM|nr:2271_t:CDS:2 [Diversispora eburnea]
MSRDDNSVIGSNANEDNVQGSSGIEIELEILEGSSQAGPSSGSQTLGEFFKEVNSIQDMIRSIKENLIAIQDLHKRILITLTQDESSR